MFLREIRSLWKYLRSETENHWKARFLKITVLPLENLGKVRKDEFQIFPVANTEASCTVTVVWNLPVGLVLQYTCSNWETQCLSSLLVLMTNEKFFDATASLSTSFGSFVRFCILYIAASQCYWNLNWRANEEKNCSFGVFSVIWRADFSANLINQLRRLKLKNLFRKQIDIWISHLNQRRGKWTANLNKRRFRED